MRTWQDYMDARVKGNESNIPWFLHDKLKCYKFCEKVGVATAQVLREFTKPDQIDLEGLDDEFVLKPTLQSSTKGVMVLKSDGDRFYDSLKCRWLTLAEIIDEQSVMFEQTKAASKKIIIERKIEDYEGHSIPRDFKAYAFRGEVALILEINRNAKPSRVAWFDGDFDPVLDDRVTSNGAFVKQVEAVVPSMAPSIVQLARTVSAKIPTPFASIDMYATSRGPIVGEVTLAPGGLYHGKHYTLSSKQQEVMGKMWTNALEEMESSRERIAEELHGLSPDFSRGV